MLRHLKVCSCICSRHIVHSLGEPDFVLSQPTCGGAKPLLHLLQGMWVFSKMSAQAEAAAGSPLRSQVSRSPGVSHRTPDRASTGFRPTCSLQKMMVRHWDSCSELCLCTCTSRQHSVHFMPKGDLAIISQEPKACAGGFNASLQSIESTQPELGPEVANLSLEVDTGLDTVRVKIRDAQNNRFEVPKWVLGEPGTLLAEYTLRAECCMQSSICDLESTMHAA